jgi:hypothetical protein
MKNKNNRLRIVILFEDNQKKADVYYNHTNQVGSARVSGTHVGKWIIHLIKTFKGGK